MSYEEASTIFFLVAKNKLLAGNLLKSDKKANQEKLKYEVKKLLDASKIDWRKAPVIKLPATHVLSTIITPKESYISKPIQFSSPVKDRVLAERKELYLQRGHFHGRLHEVSSNEERSELAEKLATIQSKINEYNRDLREIENGVIPSRYLKTTATGEEVIRIRNLKIYIARIKKQLPNETDPKKVKKLNKKLADFENELSNL